MRIGDLRTFTLHRREGHLYSVNVDLWIYLSPKKVRSKNLSTLFRTTLCRAVVVGAMSIDKESCTVLG